MKYTSFPIERLLSHLYNELGTIQWLGMDEGWELCTVAVRKRIRELAYQYGFREEQSPDQPLRFFIPEER